MFDINKFFTDERLEDEKHLRTVSDFICGEIKELEDFLKSDAFSYNKDGQGNTYLIFDNYNDNIVGYYTLRTNAIQAYDKDEKRIKVLPAVEIARFAIAEEYQGKGYGRLIFFYYILKKVLEIKSIIGVNIIMLFSVDTPQALGFYESLGFKIAVDEVEQFINEDYNKGCKLMYVNIESTSKLSNEITAMFDKFADTLGI